MFFKAQPLCVGIVATALYLGSVTNAAWNITARNNIVVYWGQNAVGFYDSDVSKHQQSLLTYCQDPTIDLIPIGFLNKWNSAGDEPEINVSNACTGWATFPGTNLLSCPTIGQDILTCQQKYGKKILLSVGGGTPSYRGWDEQTQARAFADKVWNMFGPGKSEIRPFGAAVVDGFDLDLEHSPNTGYDQFAARLRELMDADKKATGKKWILTAAPQCISPDAVLDVALRATVFDAIFIQFYNNPSCQATRWAMGRDQSTNENFNFGMWDAWVRKNSINKDLKIFLALPLSPQAGVGYVEKEVTAAVIGDIKKYPSLGGFAGWDASVAKQNPGYLDYVKQALTNANAAVPSPKRALGTIRHVHGHRRRRQFSAGHF